MPFDGGMASVVNQGPNVWQYFTVNVPANALGWDLRLTNVTSGNPQMYICYEAPLTGAGLWMVALVWLFVAEQLYDWTIG